MCGQRNRFKKPFFAGMGTASAFPGPEQNAFTATRL
jgi:hypothetical protein